MAQKRMFSIKIVGSDAFLEMPPSTRELYFQLGMYADDEGFISPKKIVRMVNANDDDLKILISKSFLIPFENGVVVIKHHRMNNDWKNDRCRTSEYKDQRNMLFLKENMAYTLDKTQGIPIQNAVVSKLDTKCIQNVGVDKIRLDKIRLDNTRKEKKKEEKKTAEQSPALISKIIEQFSIINPACQKMYGNKTQRQACQDLIDTYTFDEVINCVTNVLPRTNGQPYFPTIVTPVQLREKWVTLKSAVMKKRENQVEIMT